MNALTRLSVLFTLSFSCVAAHADSITLRGSIRFPANDNALRLDDIARLDGPEARRFADLKVAPKAAGLEAFEIDVEDIQSRLDDAGINWAMVELSGGVTVVRPRVTTAIRLGLNEASKSDGRTAVDMLAMNAVEPEAVPVRFRPLDDWCGEDPVIDEILELVHAEWGVDSEHLHLAIDTDELSAIPTDMTTCTVSSRGATRGADYFDVQVRATRGEDDLRPTKTVLLRVDARVHTDATVARNDLRARRNLRADDLTVARCLVKPSDAQRMIDPAALVGRKLAASVKAGSPVVWSTLEPEIVVNRNDSVRVVMRGAFQLSGTDALALERGSVGDRIKCRWRAGDEPFMALITAPGEVRAGG